MPLPIYLAHRLAFRLTEVRKSGEVPHLRPDGKTQVTIEYDDNDKPVRLDTVLISTQHDPEVTQDWLAVELKKHVIDRCLMRCWVPRCRMTTTASWSTRPVRSSWAARRPTPV